MHTEEFTRGKGRFMLTEYMPTDERTGARFPLILTTGRILSQYNVGAQTRRTANSMWHEEDRLEINPHDAEQRGVKDGDWVTVRSRAGETALRALITDRVAAGVVYTTFHHPLTQANVITTDFSDWATNCPEFKVTAVQVSPLERPDAITRRSTKSSPKRAAASRLPKLRSSSDDRTPPPRGLPQGSPTKAEPTSRIVPEEMPVALVYDGSTHAVMMATPADLEDFALGFSLSEGKIERPEEISELSVIEQNDGIELRMWLVPQAGRRIAARRRALLGPTGCGLCGVESLAAALPELSRVEADTTVEARDIAEAVASVIPRKRSICKPGHFMQLGSGRGMEDSLRCVRTSVATTRSDKLAGAITSQGLDPASGIVVLTSRVSVEMVQKAAILGAPVIAAVSAPTALALRTAYAAGVTLVGIARADSFEVFTHPQRILTGASKEDRFLREVELHATC